MVKCRLVRKPAGTIEDVQNIRPDLQLVTTDTDVEAIKDHFGRKKGVMDFGGFFVKIEEGDFAEVFGFNGSVPSLGKRVYQLNLVCK